MSSPVTITRYTVVRRLELLDVDPELLERVRAELAERIDRRLEAMTLAALLEPPAPAPWRVRPSPFAAASAGIVTSSVT